MALNENRHQELNRHERKVDRNIEEHQDVNLDERNRGIAAANQNSTVARIVNIIYFVFGAVELLLLVRIALHLIGANAGNGFAGIVEALSAPFVGLFASLLQNPTLGGAGVLEITTVIAMVVWAIVAWLLGRMVWLIMSRPR